VCKKDIEIRHASYSTAYKIIIRYSAGYLLKDAASDYFGG